MQPISFKFVAAGIAQQAKGALYRFSPGRTGDGPDWTNQGTQMQGADVMPPITPRDFWQDRFVLCQLTLVNPDLPFTDPDRELTINDAVATVTKNKKIVETEIVGRSGTIKEYISNGEYQISLEVGLQGTDGVVISDEYPKESIRTLRKFLELDKAFEVYSDFLDIWDISKVVVKDFSLTQQTDSNYQTLTIKLVSDEDYEIVGTEY